MYCEQKKTQEEIITILASKYARDVEIIQESIKPTTSEQQMIYKELSRFNDTMEKFVEFMNNQQNVIQDVNEIKIAISELSRVERHKKGFLSRLWG